MDSRETNNISKNIGLLILLSFLLKGIGFINRIVLAYKFGTTDGTDIYYIASGFIEAVTAIILESLSVGVVNIYVKNRGKSEKTNSFVSLTLLIVEISMCILCLATILCSKQIATILAAGYSHDLSTKLANYLVIMSFSYLFYGVTNIFCAMLQAEEKFVPVKLTGTISSISSILIVFFLADLVGEASMVIAFISAAIFNSIFIFGYVKTHLIFSLTNTEKVNEDINLLIKMAWPLMLGLAAYEVNLIIDKSVATSLGGGCVSALSYCSVLFVLVDNVIINSTITVLYPNISRLYTRGDYKLIASEIKSTLSFIELLLIPITCILFLQSEKIIRILYCYGEFGENSVALTNLALRGYILGLPFRALRDIITRFFYAYGDTRTPMCMNMISIAINIALDFILSRYWGVFGITFATTVSLAFSGIGLYMYGKKYNIDINWEKGKKRCVLFIIIYILLELIFNWKINISINNLFLSTVAFVIISFVTEIFLLSIFLPGVNKTIYNKVKILKKNKL